MKNLFINSSQTNNEVNNDTNYRRISFIVAITLLLHLLLFTILWFTIIKNSATTDLQTNQKNDTLFVEMNTQMSALGDGKGNDIKNGGPISNDVNGKDNKSLSVNKEQAVLSQNDPNNNTSLNTEITIIEKRSLYDKNKVKAGNNIEDEGGIKGDPNKNKIGNPDGENNNSNISLPGRKPISLSSPLNNTNNVGKIIVKIWVNRQGEVIRAQEVSGSTILNVQLRNMALNAALKSKFNIDPNAKEIQEGFITYLFRYFSK